MRTLRRCGLYKAHAKETERQSVKLLHQFLLIATISFMGEALRAIIPLPIPASVYGLVLLFTALMTGIIRLEQIKTAADFLIAIMAVMFIPAAVGLLDAWESLRPVLVPVCVITAVSTVFVMGVTGRVTQRVQRAGQSSGKRVND